MTLFSLDNSPPFEGVSGGTTWNGFECPMFTRSTAVEILEWLTETCPGFVWRTVGGKFIYRWPGEDEWEICRPRQDGLYPLGSCDWVWTR